MVEEIHQCSFPGDAVDDSIGMGFDFDAIVAEILNVEVGTGVVDSGATLPVVGMKCWKHWLRLPWIRAHEAEIKYDRCNKLFRFGGGKTLPSTVCVSFPVKVFNTVRQLTVYLIDSDAPLLIAQPTLEEWGIVCDFRNKRIQLLDEPELGWKTLPQSDKGHLLFDLVDSKAFGDPMVPGPADANVYSADAVVSESGTGSSASSESTGPDEGDSPVDDEEDFESNVLSAEFEPMASFDKYDTLVQANHDQLGSLEETFVLWKHV